ncbi:MULTISPECIES: branched-chain amino acid ABC transporter permease [unclassified Bradyrhizobium]|uniref:branched-chain amino acid ABC transporter permease n=1 Tax=unclassified Bradyrhizobium TaxID=2631580 RepID=UPI001CD1BB9D|nr:MULTISPECIES: branched-chain amino acid ABC transporter permease [unclassified Bradyrhizobium]MCA1430480.1 branched-chain amino acid ABC transporter permease [Bradyrhizobium sp. NBAIM16]MCA1507433.1 branched-chain amino acid ABC transporter permease [Bradyrhizobium sp. NBAIM02]
MSGFDTIIEGVLLGGVYALFALGLSLIFGIMRLVNLAHGDLILLAAYLVLSATTALGLPLAAASLLVVVTMFVLGFVLQRLVLERVLGDDILPPLLVTFGLSIVIQNGLLLGYGADSRRLQAGAFESSSVAVAPGLSVGLAPLAALVTAVAAVALLQLIFYRTSLGRAFRATADNPAIAQLMGVNERNVYAIAVGLSLAVSVIAAVVIGIRASFDPSIGPARLLYAFEAVIIGGLGSLWGTLAGGILLGLAQAIGGRINPEWQILAGHLAFLAVLMVRPRGLFPARRT